MLVIIYFSLCALIFGVTYLYTRNRKSETAETNVTKLSREERRILINQITENIKPELRIIVEKDEMDSYESKPFKVDLIGNPPRLELPLIPEEYNEDYEIQSSSSAKKTYIINLHAMTCTCPDFTKSRVAFEKTDLRRICKHLEERIRYLQTPLNISPEIVACISQFKKYKETIYTFSIQSGKYTGMVFYAGWRERNNWISVIINNTNLGKVERFGYNPEEDRWSNGQKPASVASQIADILKQNFKVTYIAEQIVGEKEN